MDPGFSCTLTESQGLASLLDATEVELSERGVPSAAISAVTVALDEVVSNALSHGKASTVGVEIRVTGGRVELEISDDGEAFDPSAAAAPDTAAPLEERTVGGLGIHLVARLMDHVAYERSGGRNHLRLAKDLRL